MHLRGEAHKTKAYTKATFMRLFTLNSEWEAFTLKDGSLRRFIQGHIQLLKEPDFFWIDLCKLPMSL